MRRDSLYVLCRLTPEDAAELSALEEKCFPSFWTAEQYAKALGKGSPYLSDAAWTAVSRATSP